MIIKRPPSKQPIPKNAKCVFRGEVFDTYQWKQKLFDGTFATFEKIKRPDTVNVIPVTTDGKILMCRQEQPGEGPFVGMFGGWIDKGESPLEAAKRELLEESGYKAQKFILWDAIQPSPKIEWAIYTFIAEGCEKISKQALESGEKIEVFSVSFEKFLTLITQENFRDREITLKILRLQQNPKEFKKLRRLFFSLV